MPRLLTHLRTITLYTFFGICSGYVSEPVTVGNTLKNNVLQALISGVRTSISMAKRIGVRKSLPKGCVIQLILNDLSARESYPKKFRFSDDRRCDRKLHVYLSTRIMPSNGGKRMGGTDLTSYSLT